MLELFLTLNLVEIDDTLASYYLECATGLVKKYVNNSDIDVVTEFKNEIVDTALWLVALAEQRKQSIENGTISSLSTTGKSISWFSPNELNAQDLPQHIKARLPHYVTVRVW